MGTPVFASVDSETLLPVPAVRAAQAAALIDPDAPEGGAVAGVVSDAIADEVIRANAAYAPYGSTGGSAGGTRFDTAGESMAAKLDMRSGNIKTVLLGDSTGNDSDEWYRKWVLAICAAYPALHVETRQWDDTTKTYLPAAVLQAGTGYSPGGNITAVSDTFTRTDSELVGDIPDVGNAWAGSAGTWQTNGSKAVCLATTTTPISAGGSVTGDMTATATGVSFDTTPGSTSRQVQLHVKYLNASNSVYVYVDVNTSGVVSWGIYKKNGGTSTKILTGSALGLTANAVNTFNMSISVTGLNVSATVNGVTGTATILQADADKYAATTSLAIGSSGGTAVAGISIDSVSLVVNAVASGQAFTAYNGSMPGSTLAYQTTNFAAMVPTGLDVAFISSGHNYAAGTPSDYVTAVQTFVNALIAQQSDVGIVVCSQNPEFPPATNIAAHQARMVALRTAALEKGWGYIPSFEAFAAQPDGGASLVNASDGIHPVATGSTLWQSVATKWLTAKSLRP